MSDLRQRQHNEASDDVEAANGINVEHKHHLPALHLPTHLPTHRLPRRIHTLGESHRKGIHPWMFLKICFWSSSHLSMLVNFLWPFTPAAIALYATRQNQPNLVFALNYVAIIPAANLIGFAGQELARKLTKVFGWFMSYSLTGFQAHNIQVFF